MIGFLIRRFRWMFLGTAARWLVRRRAERSIVEAASTLEEKLPAPVVRAAELLPGDVIRTGGAAVVAGRRARSTALVTRATAARTVSVLRPVIGLRPRQAVIQRIESGRAAIQDESERVRRSMMSDYARHVDGEGAALEALLDLRDVEEEPLPEVPEPIAPGRRRFVRGLPPAPVNRAQRSYRRPTKPWDRNPRDRAVPPR